MNRFLEWALDLDTLRFGDEGVRFGFEHTLPTWAWALVVLGAAVVSLWSYRRLEGGRAARSVLAAVRGVLLVLLVVLIAGPRLIKQNQTEEQDWVLVLVDRSASLTVADAPVGTGQAGQTVSREAQLERILRETSPTWRELSQRRTVVWLGFDSAVFDLKTKDEPPAPDGAERDVSHDEPVELGEPDGRQTSLGRAIEQALKRAAARPLAGVVVLSDGRSLDEPSRASLRELEAEQVPVFVVPLGSERAVADVGVRRVEGPRVAFVNDAVPVTVEIEWIGDGDAQQRGGVVQLVDPSTGRVLTSQRFEFSADDAGDGETRTASVTLVSTPSDVEAGSAKWEVRVVPDGPDLVAENNVEPIEVELLDRPLRVAYFDGYPRWEYRYIKNLLVREASITSAVTMLASGRRYIQEGGLPMTGLPRSAEDWRRFDVVMLGDLWPGVFTSEQLEGLRDLVAESGAGLVLIGGQGHMPGAWRDTPIGDLLPFVLPGESATSGGRGDGSGLPMWSAESTGDGGGGGPVTMRATAGAERLGVLRLAETPDAGGSWWPKSLSDPTLGWTRFWNTQRIEPSMLKPTAEVLAVAVPESGEVATPLVVSMRYGRGRVVYVGTDETWAWRYGRGEALQERFWIQIVRLLGRESVSRAAKPAVLEVTPERSELGRSVRIGVSLQDQSLVDASPPTIRVRVKRVGDVGGHGGGTNGAPPGEDMGVELTLTPDGAGRGARDGAASREFSTTWVASESGRYVVEAIDPLLLSARLSAEAEVWLPDDEMRRPQTDHPALARLAEATGGKALSARDIVDLPALLPNRRLQLMGTPEVEPLWDTPAAIILLLALLAIEWVGRRLIRLV